jgi:hypothetical protein
MDTLAKRLSQLNAPSAVDVIVAVTKATASKQEAIEALRKLASGADGVAGTADDLIPESVVGVLAFLIENGVAADIVALASSGPVGVLARRALQFVKRLCGGGGARQ